MRGLGVALGVLGAAALLAACSSQLTPTPSAAPTPSAPTYADTITVGMIVNNGGPSASQLSNATSGVDDQGRLIDRFLYRALYRYDEHFAPVPDLAAKPCDVAQDQLTVTCTLADARFSDGGLVTADDVVFTYQIAMSDQCHWPFAFSCGNGPHLAAVEALDPHTVRFRLQERDALFLTTVLPAIWIDSKKAITDAYDNFLAAEKPISGVAQSVVDDVRALFDKYDPKAPPDADCQPLVMRAEALVPQAGLQLVSRNSFVDTKGNLPAPCDWLSQLRDSYLDPIGDALEASGIDAIAAIYGSLPTQQHPVGSGLWKITDFQLGKEIALQVAPGASVATHRFIFRFFGDRRSALTELMQGTVDWVTVPGVEGFAQGSADLVRYAREDRRLQLVHFPIAGAFTSVEYNERPGQVMADALIREAVDRCLDKPGIVEAATDGIATPAWSFVAPGTWAAAADLPELPRDVSYARSKIEQAGWTMAADGHYQKGGKRLGIEVLVGANRLQRIRFLELASLQLRDCGFDLTVQPEDPRDINGALASWPQTLPDGHRFQAAMFTTFGLPDPGLMCDFDSTEVVTAASQDKTCNSGAYANSSVDRDLEAGRDTYDLAARAQYYKDMQAALAGDHAALFAWFNTQYEVLAPGLTTTTGPIDLTNAGWSSQLQTLVKTAGT